jgi:MMPL family
MDYEVFLLSRIRERNLEHGDNRRAVAEGLASSARTISSAALIMTRVFAVFVLTGTPSIKEIGLGCAGAMALDPTLVRLILVPAAMRLMGRWNWWLPAGSTAPCRTSVSSGADARPSLPAPSEESGTVRTRPRPRGVNPGKPVDLHAAAQQRADAAPAE